MSHIISDDKIDEVRDCTSIVDVVSQYVALKKAGRNFLGLCPFHSEKTPSFTVSEDKDIFHCFGCGAGGNVFSFLMRIEGKAFPETVRDLAEKAGVEIPETQKFSGFDKIPDELATGRGSLLAIHENALGLYTKLLMRSADGEQAREYLKERGIDSSLAGEWQLGFGGKGWSAFADRLKGKNLEEAEKAGLIIKGRKGGYYDRFRERLIFPICDLKGQVVAFGGRILSGEGPKYMNSPESMIYTKGKLLYGLNISKNDMRASGEALLVEGYMDFLALQRVGIKNVAATLGTALTPGQALLLKRFCKKVVLIFDSDAAGIKAAMRGLEVLMDSGLSPFVLILPEGEDPDSYVRQKSAHALRDNIRGARPALDFVVDEKMKGADIKSPSGQTALIYELINFVVKIGDTIERKLTLKRISERIGVDEKIVVEAYDSRAGNEKGQVRKRDNASIGSVSVTQTAEEMIVTIMMNDRNVLEEAGTASVFDDFKDLQLKTLATTMKELFHNGRDVNPSLLMDVLKDEGLKERVSSLSMNEDRLKEGPAMKMYEDCVEDLRKKSLTEVSRKVDLKFRQNIGKNNEKENASLLKEKQMTIQKRKKDLN